MTKKQRRAYEGWRDATELTDEERAVGLPVIPGVDQAIAPPRRPRRPRPGINGGQPTLVEDGPDQRPLRERLKDVRDPEEAEQILGRWRLAAYPVVSFLLAVACVGYIVHMVLGVTSGRHSVWTLLATPVFVLLAAASGSFAYGGGYSAITGRRWPGADKVGAIFERLNSNV